ncbi:4-hydroxyphenylpyruvate dioxygenase [Paenibacillus sp. KACC 21273]|uniref:4-hydroxyphenylpyruvate dioxygenase n=1 Tax=Paenibacillus sp. KACC 21273 TaxID=3025665 RepID=UPI0023665C6F|nr:4-hydroxyphenylpyruvate dioxygenase [Paenibacillus sp. KACC 21273]WDF53188.1 4-hydroxyphenylpyruvate dioxygenase [Paenibacillus sp. KACC 21273]
MRIEDIDYLEFYVGNAKQSAFYLSKLFGFNLVAYRGLETGDREVVSYVLKQGDITLVISSAYDEKHPIAMFVKKHGDNVGDIAFKVDDLDSCYEESIQQGAQKVSSPLIISDSDGDIKYAAINGFGDVIHTLIERRNYKGCFKPGYKVIDSPVFPIKNVSGLYRIDHLAICVESMNEWTNFYERIFGFKLQQEFKKDEISSGNSSLMTKILKNGTERVKVTFVEPAAGNKKSQIQEYMDYNNGPGVQHIALSTDNIIHSIDTLTQQGNEFLYTPDSYYELLLNRVGNIDESLEELQRLKVLVDRDEEGYLLQIFGQPIQDRPTLFFEVIQRKGSKGFGNGNIAALFEAVEREQAKRGNL